MMRPGVFAIGLCLAAAFVGCTGIPEPAVEMRGDPQDWSGLRGEWTGEFRSHETGRQGDIYFRLDAGADSAFGDVLMNAGPPIRDPWSPNFRPANVTPPGTIPIPRWLSIRWVKVENGYVSGRIERYTDPLCNCDVRTTFLGRLRGNRIEGGYTTRGIGRSYESGGRFSVHRR